MGPASVLALLCLIAYEKIEPCLRALAPSDHNVGPDIAWRQAALYIERKSSEEELPSGSPREIHLALGRNSQEIQITWVTHLRCNQSRVFILDAAGVVVRTVKATTYSYKTPKRWWPSSDAHIHTAKVIGLRPGTSVSYAVGVRSMGGGEDDSCSMSEVEVAHVPPKPGNMPIKAALTADVGSIMPLGFYTWKVLSERAEDLLIDVAVHAGDVSYAGMDTQIPLLNVSKDDEFEPLWDLYGQIHEPFTRRYPYQIGVGNHEAWYNWTAVTHRYPMTHQSRQPSARVEERGVANPPFWYSFETGGIRFVMISSEHDTSKDSPQHSFIVTSLKATNRTRTPWLIAVWHRPYYCSEAGYSHESLREEIEPLLVSAGVDLVVTGHEHGYERIHPVVNFTVQAHPLAREIGGRVEDVYVNPRAPAYLMIGNGGAAQVEKWDSPQPDWSATRYSQGCDFSTRRFPHGYEENGSLGCAARVLRKNYSYTDTFGFTTVEAVNATHLHVEAHMLTGSFRESFWIVKSDPDI